MNGAKAVVQTLVGSGVTTCFANPGTSEMHFVAALDAVPEMRGVLCLFEGVVTGAADGYGRMTGTPAGALLHLGPGLANGLANLHNARRAHTPLLPVVGDHAIYHKRYDAPLESDIDALAGSVSGWVRRSYRSTDAPGDAAQAVAAALAPPGQIATLILPGDVTWTEGAEPAAPVQPRVPSPVPGDLISEIAAILRRGEPAMILLGGSALRKRGLEAASRIGVATGARLLAGDFAARWERGAGIPAVGSVAYFVEMATTQFEDVKHVILAGAPAPVSFFAYPGRPSHPLPPGCTLHVLADASDDITGALEALASVVAEGAEPVRQPAARPAVPSGPLTPQTAADVIGALMPDGAIVSDESNTGGIYLPSATAGAPPHDWLSLTGGAIGQGLPLATGAAIACPDRPVLALEADGSAMYTVSALWTHAREQLDITTIVFSNRSYAILALELERTGAPVTGTTARSLLELTHPVIDFCSLATGLGVPANRAETSGELADQLAKALAEPGPHLIEAVLPGPR